MKKITLLALGLCISGISFAQESISSAGFEITNNVSATTAAAQVACTTEIVSTSIDMGFGNLNANEVGDNFTVPADEFFEITDGTVFVIADNTSDAATFANLVIRLYESAGEFPSTIISEDIIVSPTVTDLGDVNASLNAYQLDFTLNSSVTLEAPGAETEFWFSVFLPNSTSASNFLETTDETSDTTLAAFKTGNDPAAAWSNTFTDGGGNPATLPPGVAYNLNGDCDPLSVNDNVLADNISVFPNPTTTDLNINFARNFGATNVAVINVNGQKVLNASMEGFGNNTIATSKLANGIYFAQVTTQEGTTTIKFIKN
ncbi:T9SS type A sorting domain-containing protein [uncultured Dokdonia sp.]|uniref:T9SS type A sorting domain-containing protein n=1 Tax=uncultured Dokdonia sp. TaxID=575653 RepID=UPI002635860C|nr:T9SS type A sorting domain-containing protein [uncultured Dokdonia sp.]